jgi:hypothetical protein
VKNKSKDSRKPWAHGEFQPGAPAIDYNPLNETYLLDWPLRGHAAGSLLTVILTETELRALVADAMIAQASAAR